VLSITTGRDACHQIGQHNEIRSSILSARLSYEPDKAAGFPKTLVTCLRTNADLIRHHSPGVPKKMVECLKSHRPGDGTLDG